MTINSVEPASVGAVASEPTVTPDEIMQLGLGFGGSKALLSAIELDVFSTLSNGPVSEEGLRAR